MLTYYISVWYAGCSAVDIKALRGVVKSAVKILIPHFVYFVFIFIYIFTLFIVFILHPVILLLQPNRAALAIRLYAEFTMTTRAFWFWYSPIEYMFVYLHQNTTTHHIHCTIWHSRGWYCTLTKIATKNLLELSFNRCVQSLSAPTHSHHCFQNCRLFFVTTGLQLKTADTISSDPACMLLLFLPSGKLYQSLSSKTTWLKK